MRSSWAHRMSISVKICSTSSSIDEMNAAQRKVVVSESMQTSLSEKDDMIRELKNNLADQETQYTEIQVKYDVTSQELSDSAKELAEKIENLENYRIPLKFDYDKISSLSAEGKEKLIGIRPLTIGQASRISGVSPSDISILMVYMGK